MKAKRKNKNIVIAVLSAVIVILTVLVVIMSYNMKKANAYKQIVVIDLQKDDDIDKIKTRLYNSAVNVDVLSNEEGEEYIRNFFENENISF